MVECPILMPCGNSTLLGVVARPGSHEQALDPRHGIGVVIVVGGPQYRAGSHRLFVRLARRLADEGYPTLRFDARGMGDSTGALRNFEQIEDDIGAAIDGLVNSDPGVRKVVLWGLCDGASACLLYLDCTADSRVAGVCLLNPWVRSEQSKARTYVKHYYRARLLDPKVWLKALRGGLAPGALRDAWAALRRSIAPDTDRTDAAVMSYQERMARGWSQCPGELLLLLSDKDYTAREFTDTTQSDLRWISARSRVAPLEVALDDADHTLSGHGAQLAGERALLSWLEHRFARASSLNQD